MDETHVMERLGAQVRASIHEAFLQFETIPERAKAMEESEPAKYNASLIQRFLYQKLAEHLENELGYSREELVDLLSE
jgi:hypothetical protein